MLPIIIPTGCVFGRLTVVKDARDRSGKRAYLCSCQCGRVKIVNLQNLRRGLTKSCGCLHREIVSTHQMSNSPTHRSWSHMIQRCTNPKFKQFSDYGGRGISVCERWRRFENFLADMGTRPTSKSIDRWPDKNGNYEPGNCRWADSFQQNQNTRKSVYVLFLGERLSMSEFSRRIGMPRSTALDRIKRFGSLNGGVLVNL
jgi:hypothetical protein